MLEVKCPECNSIHVSININRLCGSASEGAVIYWAICNEVDCKAQFHLKFELKDPEIIPLSKERYIDLENGSENNSENVVV